MMPTVAALNATRQLERGEQGAFGWAPAALIRRLKAGETLFIEGDLARYCYEVVTGVMKEYSIGENGQREISDFYAKGDFVGVCGHDEQMQTAEAVTNCSLRCIPRDALFRPAGARSEGSALLVELLVGRLDRCRERAVLVSRRSAEQRVAGFLRFLARRAEDRRTILIPMSRQDIGDYLGLTIETVCRTLTELKRCGAIAMPAARSFTILDEAALEATERALN